MQNFKVTRTDTSDSTEDTEFFDTREEALNHIAEQLSEDLAFNFNEFKYKLYERKDWHEVPYKVQVVADD